MYPNMLNLDMRILMRSFVGLSNTNTADILRTNNLSTLSMEYIAVRYQWMATTRIRGKLNMATKRNHPILNHSPHSLVRHRHCSTTTLSSLSAPILTPCYDH